MYRGKKGFIYGCDGGGDAEKVINKKKQRTLMRHNRKRKHYRTLKDGKHVV